MSQDVLTWPETLCALPGYVYWGPALMHGWEHCKHAITPHIRKCLYVFVLQGKKILELGCGHGLPGILAMLAGAEVHFQVGEGEWWNMGLGAQEASFRWPVNQLEVPWQACMHAKPKTQGSEHEALLLPCMHDMDKIPKRSMA